VQIEHAPQLSPRAKLIKLADKICNVRDVTHTSPKDWDEPQRLESTNIGCRHRRMFRSPDGLHDA
jgi:(p)ppGpp synthase/HD superfamily hydrolase